MELEDGRYCHTAEDTPEGTKHRPRYRVEPFASLPEGHEPQERVLLSHSRENITSNEVTLSRTTLQHTKYSRMVLYKRWCGRVAVEPRPHTTALRFAIALMGTGCRCMFIFCFLYNPCHAVQRRTVHIRAHESDFPPRVEVVSCSYGTRSCVQSNISPVFRRVINTDCVSSPVCSLAWSGGLQYHTRARVESKQIHQSFLV